IEVIQGRAEGMAHAPRLREQFDLVSARALATLPALLELTLPYLRIGGHLAAIKSAAGIETEVEQAARALELLGGGAPACHPYDRGDGKASLVLLVAKQRPTPAGYPRREGLPQRRPLA